MKKEQCFAADAMASKSEREIAADRPLPFKRKHKKNSGSVLTRRKHTKYVRPGDVY